MAKAKKYGLREIRTEFPTEASCLAYLFDSLHTRKCSCGGVYAPLEGRKQFQCSKCRFQIAPMAGTIFHKSSTPLTLWFHAIFIFSNAKSGISAKEMERQLNVTYKTAWRILSLIRKCLKQKGGKLGGFGKTVEIDEAFFGGKGEGGKYNVNLRNVMEEKSKVIAAVERGGNVKAEVVQAVSTVTLNRFLSDNVEVSGTHLMTDGSNRYQDADNAYMHSSVNHSRKEFVRGKVHVNAVEGFWAHMRRSINGTFKVVSKKHLQSYIDGFTFHYNNRRNDRERFASLMGAVLGASPAS